MNKHEELFISNKQMFFQEYILNRKYDLGTIITLITKDTNKPIDIKLFQLNKYLKEPENKNNSIEIIKYKFLKMNFEYKLLPCPGNAHYTFTVTNDIYAYFSLMKLID